MHYGGRYRQNKRTVTPSIVEPTVIAATPATFAAALSAANAGEVIELAVGTYSGTWQVNTQNLTIRNKAGARPVVDGGFDVRASGVTVRGLEILNSAWVDRATVTGIVAGVDIIAGADNCKVQNCLIHDTRDGIICAADGLETTGNAFWNIGAGALYHPVYSKNDGVVSLHRDNIFAQNYSGWNLHTFSDGGTTPENDTQAIGNVSIQGKFINYALTQVTHGVLFEANEIYRGSIRAGQASQDNQDVTLTNNYIAYGKDDYLFDVQRWGTVDISGNTLMSDDAATSRPIKYVPCTPVSQAWHGNAYYYTAAAGKFANDNGTDRTFAGWQTAHSWDADSTLSTSLPAANRIVIRQNPIDSERAWIVVYNWENRASIEIDLSGLGLTRGARYQLRQAQDPLNDVQGFVFLGSTVNVSMSGHTVAVPTGAGAAIVASTFPQFGCWLLEKA